MGKPKAAMKPASRLRATEAAGKRCTEFVSHFTLDYLRSTSLHGMQHLAKPRRHFLERVFWLCTVLAAGCSVGLLVHDNWHRYAYNPVVVSLEKDFRSWNTSFPAVTVCYHDKLDATKAEAVISREWGVKKMESPAKFQYYFDYLKVVANLSYQNIESLRRFSGDSTLKAKNFRQLAVDVNLNMQANVVLFKTDSSSRFAAVFLEMGVCHSYGSALAPLLSTDSRPMERLTLNFWTPLQCNYLNSLCYGRMGNFKREIDFYVHSAYDIPGINSRAFSVHHREERNTGFRVLSIYASDELHSLRPVQRKCRFLHEGVAGLPVYSHGLCQLQCRASLAEQFCACRPHFYPILEKKTLCDIDGLLCLIEHKELIHAVGRTNSTTSCSCLHQCDESNYQLDTDTLQLWAPPVPADIRFRWAIDKYSKTRLRRDVIFGLTEFLVSLGGTAGLFLGCSLLSAAELFFFLVFKLPGQILNAACQKLNGILHH